MEQNSNFIKDTDTVKVKQVLDTVEIFKTTNCNHLPIVKKIGKNLHINTRTGEIIQDKPANQTLKDYWIKVTNNNLADLIKNNLFDIKKVLLLTLTYSNKQSDYKKIAEDYKRFIKKLRQEVTLYGRIEYIYVLELYDDLVNYHLHAILFFNETIFNVFIDKELIYKLWGHGDISVGQPTKNNQVVSYLTAHKVKTITKDNRHMHEKALRQEHLPTGFRYYRYSKGIKKPTIFTDTYKNAVEFLANNGFDYKKQQLYPSSLKSLNGNTLYYCKQYFQKHYNGNIRAKPYNFKPQN